MSEPVREFTVIREKWLRGENGEFSCMLSLDDRRCCLGFYAQALGYRDCDLMGPGDAGPGYERIPLGTPDEVRDVGKFPQWLVNQQLSYRAGHGHNTAACTELMLANDSKCLTDEQRERAVTEIFARHGVTVKFA